MSAGPRYAVYWAPETNDPLWQAGAAWLGRDPAGGALPLMRPGGAELDEITRTARTYGFHATLKPPMRLHPEATRADLTATLHDLAGAVPAFALPPLAVADWEGFLCLRETAESAALQALADAMVAGLDHLRAPLSPRELELRRSAGLSPPRQANLLRWGYPDVFGTWFFHMTLSRRLLPPEAERLRPAAEQWFAAALAQERRVVDVCLFEQSGPSQDFMMRERIKLAS